MSMTLTFFVTTILLVILLPAVIRGSLFTLACIMYNKMFEASIALLLALGLGYGTYFAFTHWVESFKWLFL